MGDLFEVGCEVFWNAEDIVKVVRDPHCISRCLSEVVYGDQGSYFLVKRIVNEDLALAAVVYGFRIVVVNSMGIVQDVFLPRCEKPLTIYVLRNDDGYVDIITSVTGCSCLVCCLFSYLTESGNTTESGSQ